METRKKKLTIPEMNVNCSKVIILGSVLVSAGVLLVTIGGSWDITNHLLNKPETFFSPPHGLLYTGVGITILGSMVCFVGWKKIQIESMQLLSFPIKLILLGVVLLVSSGPFDFFWHDNFGLDGLLSPPHLALILGMIISSIGAMVVIARSGNMPFSVNRYTSNDFFIVLAILPIWLAASGLFYSFSLPFSNTEFFEFNPDPGFAVVFATFVFPLLPSLLLLLSWRMTCKFGIISIVGALFLLINGATAILPNVSLLHTIPFYALNFIPFLAADCIVNIFRKSKKLFLISGVIVSVPFYLIYFPLITHTYNEVLTKQIVWPSLTSKIYFGMIPEIFPLVVLPAILMGIVGAFLSVRLSEKIMPIAKTPKQD